MLRKIFLLAFCLLLALSLLFSQGDTITSRFVGPGVKHIFTNFPSVPWTINVLEVDITNSYITLETVKASKDGREQLRALEKTSLMAGRKSRESHVVVGAINGDFYNTSTGEPINIQVENGEILKRPYPRSVFAITEEKKPAIEIFTFSGKVFTKNDSSFEIGGINETRGENMLILYNSYFGFTTGTNQWGCEVLVRPIGGWKTNDTTLCVVDTIVVWVGNMQIPLGKAVLSGHGRAREFLTNNVRIKDTLKIYLQLSPNVGRIFQAIGGLPRIIRSGRNVVAETYQSEGASSSFTYSRHPRTAVGFSKDSTKIYFVTVDGRQTSSVGMTLDELANFMLSIGVWEGVNLDGGGSTTIVVRGQIVNSPSDATGERSVSNALLVISSAPTDTLNKIEIHPKRLKIFRGEQFQFKIFGYDKYLNPVQILPGQILWSCDSTIGKINQTGLFTAGKFHDSGFVYVRHQNGLADSCFVIVHTMENISISPRKAVTDTMRIIQFSAKGYDTEGNLRQLSASEIIWDVDDTTVGNVNSLGVFRGLREGTCKVIANFDFLYDTAIVQVTIGKGEVTLENFSEMNFSVSGENIDSVETRIFLSDSTFLSPPRSLGILYKFKFVSGKQNWIYINSNIPIDGVPDSIHIYAFNDTLTHKIFYFVSDDNDEIFVFSGGNLNPTKTWQKISTSTKYPIQTASGTYFSYPIKIIKIGFLLGNLGISNVEHSGKFFIDDLKVTYPNKMVKVESWGTQVSDFKFHQNFPNPFNSETMLTFQLPSRCWVALKVYDVLGREMKEIFKGYLDAGTHRVRFDARELPSGIYFALLSAGNFKQTIKLVVIK